MAVWVCTDVGILQEDCLSLKWQKLSGKDRKRYVHEGIKLHWQRLFDFVITKIYMHDASSSLHRHQTTPRNAVWIRKIYTVLIHANGTIGPDGKLGWEVRDGSNLRYKISLTSAIRFDCHPFPIPQWFYTNHGYTDCNDNKLAAFRRSAPFDKVECWSESLTHGQSLTPLDNILPETHLAPSRKPPVRAYIIDYASLSRALPSSKHNATCTLRTPMALKFKPYLASPQKL